MGRLRLQFVLFFVLLAGSLGFLVWNSYRQLVREERELWRAQTEKVYNQMQAAVSGFLTGEDERRWSDYRFWGTLTPDKYPKQPVGFSPISRPPEDDARGLIGYFQIDPLGRFSTPYLPEDWPEGMDTLVHRSQVRRELFRRLEGITSSLRSTASIAGTPTGLASQGFVELGDLKKSAGEILEDLSDDLAAKPADAPKAESGSRAERSNTAAEEKPASLDGEFARSKNVYPNPIQEQAVQLEKRKGAAPFKKMEKVAQKDDDRPPAPVVQAAPPMPASSLPESPTANAPAGGYSLGATKPMPAEAEKEPAPQEAPAPVSILADPFQARLVADHSLIFYRKVWADRRQYLQGFVVDLEKFYAWLMDQSFANSELPEFALARLELQGRPLAQYGIVDLKLNGQNAFFERALGYPLNLFDWRVYASRLPELGGRWFLNLLTGLVALLATIGLYLIYRTASTQVAYSQKRQDFVSSVTHELKTPLTSIRMYSEMLEDGWAQDEGKRKEYYGQISKESGRLSRLIENVLQLARLEKKSYKLNLKKEVPNHDFEEICAELVRIAERQGFELAASLAPGLPPVTYDPEAVKQIFFSLLDNSLKFGAGAADKSLEAALEQEGDHVVWAWRDRGPGIPEKELSRVFEDFYRVENELTRKTQGTGIGLAMSRMLARAMGAEIEARNRSGGGLEVRLLFPVSSKS